MKSMAAVWRSALLTKKMLKVTVKSKLTRICIKTYNCSDRCCMCICSISQGQSLHVTLKIVWTLKWKLVSTLLKMLNTGCWYEAWCFAKKFLKENGRNIIKKFQISKLFDHNNFYSNFGNVSIWIQYWCYECSSGKWIRHL